MALPFFVAHSSLSLASECGSRCRTRKSGLLSLGVTTVASRSQKFALAIDLDAREKFGGDKGANDP